MYSSNPDFAQLQIAISFLRCRRRRGTLTKKTIEHDGTGTWVACRHSSDLLSRTCGYASILTMGAVGGIGAKLLSKMGWTEGTGLGARRDGRVEPLTARRRVEKLGVGAERRPFQDAWWERTLEEAFGKPASVKADGDDLLQACEGRRCRPHGSAKLARLDRHDNEVGGKSEGEVAEGEKGLSEKMVQKKERRKAKKDKTLKVKSDALRKERKKKKKLKKARKVKKQAEAEAEKGESS